VSIDNAGKELKANMTGNAEIRAGRSCRIACSFPRPAVVYDAQRRAFVDVVDPAERTGRRRVPIKVGVGNGTRIQVLEGLKQGDKVVLPG
jgi:HlyD family secretion protein